MSCLWGVRTYFSTAESILRPDSFLERIKELGHTHVAIADTMTVSSIIDASTKAKKVGVEVIAGATLRVRHWANEEVFAMPKVYCENEDSFVQLMKTLSEAQTTNRVSSISWDSFINMLSSARYLVTTGDAHSIFSSAFPAADVREFCERVWTAQSDAEKQGLAVELVAVKSPFYDKLNRVAREFADANNMPYIIGGMPLYEQKDHAEARDVMHAIIRNLPKDHGARMILEGIDFSLKSQEQIEAIVGKPHAQEEVMRDKLAFRWKKMPVSLPKMADDEFAELTRLCKEGWVERIHKPVLGYKPDPSLHPTYVARLKMELSVLRQLGFCNYFLLVADTVRWAKSNGIMVGPGRGSVGGSLVAFLIGITEVDPIRFNLLFERFINPERLDLPDADLDFMSERRREVIEYLKAKYGEECVALIANYNTLGPTSAIGEVGKFLGIPPQDMAFKSFLPKEHGQPVPLEDAINSTPELEVYAQKYPHAYKTSLILQDQLRSLGTHAAGVIVAAEPIKNRAVLQAREGDLAVNWDKRVVEDQGLVKIDILGLTNLDVLARAARKVKDDYGKEIDFLSLPLDDEKVLTAFGQGDTIGVFQFEGGGMRKLLKDLAKGGPLTFEDLSAATALFRPGPLDSGLLDDFVAIRQGVTPEFYEHPNMVPALKPTFGVIVYQEQVMQLARDLAGFTLAGADHLRKAMGKKDKEKMAEQRDKWVAGCKAHSGMDEADANALFDKIELFAGYAFNRSHSVEYAIVSYWTMWLKVYYPHAFFAAALEVFKEDKLAGLVADAAKRGIEILPPDINKSTSEFRRFGDHLLAPFNRIKGLAANTEQAILAAREKLGGAFKSVEELVANVPARKCNSAHIRKLEEVGAFASIIPGSLPPRHPDRVKTQLELLPGLIAARVRADRSIVIDDYVKGELTKLYLEMREGGAFVLPRFGKKPKVVVVFEAPNFQDEKAGKLMESGNADCVKQALKEVGLSMADCYFTCMLKKPKSGKQPSAEDVAFSKPYFEREMELLKPPVIVALGSYVAREFLPEMRGSINDVSGQVVFDHARDANIVVTVSPGQVWFDPSKQTLINEAFAQVVDLLN